MSTAIAVSDCVYTPCFCEENAYKLCERLCKHSSQVYVVFVSNPSRQVPFWRDRFSHDPDGFVLWDYHVIVLQQTEQGCSVWDLDTTLPVPCPLLAYANIALKAQLPLNANFSRWYRVVTANDYLQHFASDRSHMQLEDGFWRAAPPTYSCIIASDGVKMRLEEYISMTASAPQSENSYTGTVYTERAFLDTFVPEERLEGHQQDRNLLSVAAKSQLHI